MLLALRQVSTEATRRLAEKPGGEEMDFHDEGSVRRHRYYFLAVE